MKKLTLLLSVQLFCVYGFAQQTVYVNQGFSSVPPTGWTIDTLSSNWSSSATANAGGTAPEAMFNRSPIFTGTSRLISPSVDVSGAGTLYLTFKHFIDYHGNAFTVGVATRANGGAWHTVWSIVDPTANVGPEDVFVNINNGDQNSTAFQFCFFFSGYSYNIDYWYIDNVLLYKPCTNDGAMVAINNGLYAIQGNISIDGIAKNMGSSVITSMDIKYKIDAGGTPQTTSLTGLNVAPGATQNFTCTPWAAAPGNYTLYVWTTNVNGAGADCNASNDTLKKSIIVASQTTTRLPLFEEFTSSTCGPCANFNTNYFGPFINSHPGEFSLIKYQMNWPGNGDPYYNAGGGTRRSYYNVSSIPDLFVDGSVCGQTTAELQSALTAEAAKPTYFAINLTPTYYGNNISIPVTIDPYITGSFKVYVVIVEKVTTGNVGTNGETSWKNVMMKILPYAAGLTCQFTVGSQYNNTFTYTHSVGADSIEQMTNLQAVAFIQQVTTKEVFQSANHDISLLGIDMYSNENISIYPNPVTDNVSIINAGNASLMLYDIYGKLIMSKNNIGSKYILNVSGLTTGTYIIRLINGDKAISRKITVLK